MQGCEKCMKMCGTITLVLGILFLLRDLSIWHFWNIQWWTAAFLMMGLGKVGSQNCKACKSKK
ncbi:hypothetical protein CMO91_01905 [Candidatus Woesearchaeota archaeon]|nr:hypothetical protein [Candidatus Woesearchaeota archaeon]